MAKNQHEDQDSGDEIEVSSPENAVSESESESEPEQPAKKLPASAPKKPQQPQNSSSSSSSSEAGSESESESEPGRVTQEPNVKPLSSKPMDTKKPGSKTKPSSGAGAKRPAVAEEVGEKESKRLKKKPEQKVEPLVQKTPNEDVKRQLFQRLWSEDDEIAILKGMIDYKLKKKSDPVSDLNAFHEFIKKSLHVDVSKTQLQDKIRRLKKKYENNAVKERKGKKERTFSKPHEQKAYDLSKKIWAKDKNVADEVVDRVVESNGTGKKGESKSGVLDGGVKGGEDKKSVGDEVENVVVEGSKSLSFFVSCGTSLDDMEKWLEENSGLVSVEKRNEMKRKLRSLKAVEMDLLAKRYQLINEQVSLVSEATKALEN